MIPRRSGRLERLIRGHRAPAPPTSSSSEATQPPPAPPDIEIDLTNAKEQLQSPLFSKIPPEIRNEIFDLALQEYTDEKKTYERDTFWKRPGYEGEKRVDVALLRTCKVVYGETRQLPMRGVEITAWLGASRAPRASKISTAQVFSTLPPVRNLLVKATQKRASHPDDPSYLLNNRVHVFAQMYAIKDGMTSLFSYPLAPSTVVLTIRYADWWWWEENRPIAPLYETPFFPMQDVILPNSVKKMVVEFESIEGKRKELEKVIGEIFAKSDHWVWNRKDGAQMLVNGEPKDRVKEWKWMGPTSFGGRRYPHHGNGMEMGMVVKVVEWVVESSGKA